MQSELLDQPTAVRPGEALDTAKLQAYLLKHLPDLAGSLVIEQFPAGFSNLTYLVWAGNRQMVLRRPPFGANIKGGHDMGREYRILCSLIGTYGKVPRPLAYCADESVLGAPFYLMERVPGVVLRPSMGLDAALMRRVCLAFIDTLVDLHGLNYHAAGLADLGRPEGYTARQVNGWIKRYGNAQTDIISEMESVADWLQTHLPTATESSLIHNDFRYDNVILDPTDFAQVVAILDWEMATLGDPLTDVGTTLAYWIEPGDPAELQEYRISALPGNLDRQQFVERYAERSGRDVSHILFYYVYGLFKNAVIVQQIYYRYRQGFTQDQRFARLGDMVRAYARQAVRTIEQGRISHL